MAVHVVCVWHLMKSEIIKDRCQHTYVVDEYHYSVFPFWQFQNFHQSFVCFCFQTQQIPFLQQTLEDLHLVGYVTWTFHNRCNLRTSFCCKILLRIIFFPPEILHWKSISSLFPSLSTIQLAKHLLLIITLNRRFYILLVPTTSCKLLLDTISH